MESDGDDVVLELWILWSTPSFPLIPVPLLPGVVVIVRVLSVSQTELFDHLPDLESFTHVKTNE